MEDVVRTVDEAVAYLVALVERALAEGDTKYLEEAEEVVGRIIELLESLPEPVAHQIDEYVTRRFVAAVSWLMARYSELN